MRKIRLASGRTLITTPVFDSYWKFAFERQELFMRRLSGSPPPWTDDPVLLAHRFTNVYRASDRVSQHLIQKVIYQGDQTAEEVFFRIMLFKFFNKIQTWERLVKVVGFPSWATFDFERYTAPLDEAFAKKEPIYSAAYIMPDPSCGQARKHWNHLELLTRMMKDGAPKRVAHACSLEEIFQILLGYPSFGRFLAFQLAIDLNYSEMINFSEMDFVVAGPGASDGIAKCFQDRGGLTEAETIRAVAEMAEDEFARLHLPFQNLWGRKLQLIDCQNIFCEVGKYARLVHPDVVGTTDRTRIKQKFHASQASSLQPWYPPKWCLDVPSRLGY